MIAMLKASAPTTKSTEQTLWIDMLLIICALYKKRTWKPVGANLSLDIRLDIAADQF